MLKKWGIGKKLFYYFFRNTSWVFFLKIFETKIPMTLKKKKYSFCNFAHSKDFLHHIFWKVEISNMIRENIFLKPLFFFYRKYTLISDLKKKNKGKEYIFLKTFSREEKRVWKKSLEEDFSRKDFIFENNFWKKGIKLFFILKIISLEKYIKRICLPKQSIYGNVIDEKK